jgi:hypothetical protein
VNVISKFSINRTAWAGGPTNYAAGPYSMIVKSLLVTDYSTGTSYTYGDKSGTYQSIKSTGGQINLSGSSGGIQQVTSPASLSTTLSRATTGGATSTTASTPYTVSIEGVPSGWVISSSGKLIPNSANSTLRPSAVLLTRKRINSKPAFGLPHSLLCFFCF